MEKTIRCLIVDDEPAALAEMERLLKRVAGVQVLGALNDPATVAGQMAALQPDLLFLDIQMPGKSGFEVIRDMQLAGNTPVVIFVTAFDTFAIEAIRHAAFDYLVKPVDPDELERALARFRKAPARTDLVGQFTRLIERTLARPRLKIPNAGGFTLIDPADIVYIHADWNYAEIFTGPGKSELATLNIGSVSEMLPGDQFYRISRSVIINVYYLKKVNRKKRLALLVKDGNEYAFPIPLLNIRKLERFLERDGRDESGWAG